LPAVARRILIAVSDDALPEVSAELLAGGLRNGMALHTSGAAGPDALRLLRSNSNFTGVLHPLQTIPTREAGVASLPGSAFAFAGDEAACVWAQQLIESLDGTPLRLDGAGWPLYHAAAVVASNYQVTLTDAALELMELAGVPRSEALQALAPLVLSAAANTVAMGPAAALTGPVRRADMATVERHLRELRRASPAVRNLYTAAGLRCVELARRAGLTADDARRLTDLFRTEGAITETAETDS
jgi:predicted short-subunit dehydrogenase-like oxidoreductase (DUF2520 family)